MISYKKLLTMLSEKGISIYDFKKYKIVGTATIDKLRNNTGNIDTRSINSICAYLHCQPGDIMEYVPDNEEINKWFIPALLLILLHTSKTV